MKDQNFRFIPGETTRAKSKGGYTTWNGIQKSLLESFLLIATSEENSICPIISQCSVKVIPVSYATDGLSLKPGLQFDSRLKELVQLAFQVDLEYVQANPKPNPKCSKLALSQRQMLRYLLRLMENLHYQSVPVSKGRD